MREEFQPAVYILFCRPRALTYIGVTSNLMQRVWQHRCGIGCTYTRRYNLKRLACFELLGTMELAIGREKQIKNWHRPWKHGLVEDHNPEWRDLAEDIGLPLLG